MGEHLNLCGEPITQAEAKALKLFLTVLRTSAPENAKALIHTGWANFKYPVSKIPARPFTDLAAVPDLEAPILRLRVVPLPTK